MNQTVNNPNGQPLTPPQPGSENFDQRMRAYEAWQRDEGRRVQQAQTDALLANERASRELIALAAGIPGTQRPVNARRELTLRILLAQPQVTGQTGLNAVDCAMQLADAFLVRFPEA